ncbi:MAG: PrsW family glutamic-type intramembrane protease, partial [Clostridium sp.]|nr:PrsW family glutamic-type intramembrane protease [Clostridium sp.]
METIFVFVAALLPACILLFYIYWKDCLQREPLKELLKAFFAGAFSVVLSLMISLPLTSSFGISEEVYTLDDALFTAFFSAAIPEEIAKFLMFWLVVRKNRYFDEHADGIVYAACVSLGFAAVENLMYLFSSYDAWVSVGISRALFSIPGHFAFGVLMGYYYSLVKFSRKPLLKNKILVLAAPVLAHGIYDFILFVTHIVPLLSGILMIVFLVL